MVVVGLNGFGKFWNKLNPSGNLEIDFSKPQYYMPGGNFDSLCVVSSNKIKIQKLEESIKKAYDSTEKIHH